MRAAGKPARSALARRRSHAGGFGLAELLVASAVGGLVVVAAVMALGPHLRLNQRMEGYTRLQERWIRVAFLLDTEIQAASSVSTATGSLTLIVPVSTATGSTTSTITYYQQGTTLLRDGPAISASGELQPDSTTTGVLVIDGVATGGFVPVVEEGNTKYTINLIDPNSDATYSGRGSVARGRADCQSFEADAEGSCS